MFSSAVLPGVFFTLIVLFVPLTISVDALTRLLFNGPTKDVLKFTIPCFDAEILMIIKSSVNDVNASRV